MRSKRAASGQVTAPPSSVTNSRRFIRPPIPHSGRCRQRRSTLEFAIGEGRLTMSAMAHVATDYTSRFRAATSR